MLFRSGLVREEVEDVARARPARSNGEQRLERYGGRSAERRDAVGDPDREPARSLLGVPEERCAEHRQRDGRIPIDGGGHHRDVASHERWVGFEVLEDRVYVFTPKGKVLDLPTGSTPTL